MFNGQGLGLSQVLWVRQLWSLIFFDNLVIGFHILYQLNGVFLYTVLQIPLIVAIPV